MRPEMMRHALLAVALGILGMTAGELLRPVLFPKPEPKPFQLPPGWSIKRIE